MGTRLRSEVADRPKCLAPVAGFPFLHYLMENLEAAGFGHIILSLGYMHSLVEQWLRDGKWSAEITTVVETEPLGTGGGVRLALEKARENDVFILNGDTWLDVPFRRMMALHLKSGCKATLALKPVADSGRYGAVAASVAGGVEKVVSFHEKRQCGGGLINGGVYIIRKDTLKEMPGRFSLEKDFFEKEASSGNIAAFRTEGFFIDIGIPDDYSKAQGIFAEGSYKRYDTLFLDRDGVINRELTGSYVRNPEEFEFLPGAREALRRLGAIFARIVVITNQRGVTKGLMTLSDLETVHSYMISEVEKAGGRIDAVYYSTGMDCSDPMRKPNPGMIFKAVGDRPQTDLKRSIMAGDKDSDMQCAANAGVRGERISEHFTLEDLASRLIDE